MYTDNEDIHDKRYKMMLVLQMEMYPWNPTLRDFADAFGCAKSPALRTIKILEERGKIISKKRGKVTSYLAKSYLMI